MKILNAVAYLVVALCGAYIGSIISGEEVIQPARHEKLVDKDKVRIVRFSKHYACQSTDKACIHNGMVQFGNTNSGF